MKLIATHKITFAIGHKGSAILVDVPQEMKDANILDGDSLDDNAFTETPTEPGFYRATAEVWFQQGYYEGYPADGESDIEIRTVDVERIEASEASAVSASEPEQSPSPVTSELPDQDRLPKLCECGHSVERHGISGCLAKISGGSDANWDYCPCEKSPGGAEAGRAEA